MMQVAGPVIAIGAIVAYLAMLALHRFTYRTWIFDSVVVAGMMLAIAGWIVEGVATGALIAIGASLFWFVVIRNELRVKGSPRLNVGVGDTLPPFEVVTVSGEVFTDRDLVESAPALLELYRGWWCPATKIQLDEITAKADQLHDAGVRVYAASVDSPEDAVPVQERLGNRITILCNVQDTTLDAIGARDRRGAAWYTRISDGVPKRAIAMPSAIVVGADGRIVHAFRSERVDERPHPEQVLASLRIPSGG